MLIPRIFGTILRALSVICLISAFMTAVFAQKVLGNDQDPASLEGSTLEAAASRPVRSPFSAEDAFRTVGKPGFVMTAEEAYRTVGGDTSRPAVGPKTAAALAAVAALNPPPPAPDTSTSMYRAGNERAAQANKARVAEIENQGILGTLRAAADASLVVNGLKWATRERFPAEPGFSAKEDALRGYDLDEQLALLGAKSQREFDRIKFDLDDRREQARKTNLHGGWVGFGASLLVFGLPFVFVAIYLTYRRLVVRPQVPVDSRANTSESVFANNIIESKVLTPDDVHFVQWFSNELGKTAGMQGFAKFIELKFGVVSIALGLMHKGVPIMLGTVVVVSDETGTSCTVRDFQNRPMPGPDSYGTIYSALTATRPSFEKLSQLTAKHARPNLWRRFFGQ